MKSILMALLLLPVLHLCAMDPEVLPLSMEDAGSAPLKLVGVEKDVTGAEWVKRFEAARLATRESEEALKKERAHLESDAERLGMGQAEGEWWDVVKRNRRASALRQLQLRRMKVETLELEVQENRSREWTAGAKLRAFRLDNEGPGETVIKACQDWGQEILVLLEKAAPAKPGWVFRVARNEADYYKRLKKLEDGREEAGPALKRVEKILSLQSPADEFQSLPLRP